MLRCEISTLLTSGWGQNENSPILGLCQLTPAADIRSNEAAPLCANRGREQVQQKCTAKGTVNLLDHLVGALLELHRHVEAKRLGGLEVITSSNLTGASTGSSLGRAPRRMRST